MKFSVETNVLRKAIRVVEQATTPDYANFQPLAEGVEFHIENQTLELITSDGFKSAYTSNIPITGEGSTRFVIPIQPLQKLVNNSKSDKISFNAQANILTLYGKGVLKTSYIVSPSDSITDQIITSCTTIPEDAEAFETNKNTFLENLESVIKFAAPKKGARDIYKGFFIFDKTIFCTSGSHALQVATDLDTQIVNAIPVDTKKMVEALQGEEIIVAVDNSRIYFVDENSILTQTLSSNPAQLEGIFKKILDWRTSKKEEVTSFTLDLEPLLNIVKLIHKFSANDILNIVFLNDEAVISTDNVFDHADETEYSESLDCKYKFLEGETIRINLSNLVPFLTHLESEDSPDVCFYIQTNDDKKLVGPVMSFSEDYFFFSSIVSAK